MDLDGDGHRDILSGSYSRMDKDMAGLFQVLYGKGDGTFRKAEVLKGTDGEPLVIPAKGEDRVTDKICTRPFAADWDGDGHLDLVVGNFAGTFYLFRGEGKGRFLPTPELLTAAGGGPLGIQGAHSDPFVVDWDGDGDLDLLSGSSEGGVSWAENLAGKGRAPDLERFRPLVEPGPQLPRMPLREGDLSGPGRATRVWVDDVNGDGKLDLLVGDSVTLVSPAKGLTDDDLKKRYAEWEEEFKKVRAAVDAAKDDAKAREKAYEEYNKAYRRRAEFMAEQMTGYVWLYLRK